MNTNDTFGARLKQLRIEKCLTQEELGKFIGVTKATVSKYESNALEVNNDTSKALAEFFNVTIDYLMCSGENGETFEEINVRRLIQEYRDLIKILDITEIEAVKEMKDRGLSIVEVNKALKKLLEIK